MTRLFPLLPVLLSIAFCIKSASAQDWQDPYDGPTDEEVQGYLAEPDLGEEDLESFDEEWGDGAVDGGYAGEEPYLSDQPNSQHPGDLGFPEENVGGFDEPHLEPLQDLPPDLQTGA